MQVNATTASLERAAPRSKRIEGLEPSRRSSLELGAARIERVRGLGRLYEGADAECRLLFQTAGAAALTSDREAEAFDLEAGHWVIQPFSMLNIERGPGCEQYAVAFPAGMLSRTLMAHLQGVAVAPLPIGGAAQLCLELGRSCLSQNEPVSAAVAETLGESLIELAKLAIIEQSGVKRGETMRETARARIQGFIHRNLSDPDLTIDRIAKRMQCTKRYLHKVFSKEGETLNQYIWAKRLDLCRARLSRPDLSDKSITEIAFSCGFSNAAHFSRSFRARFGEAPRVYRRAALDS